jgi:two-component system, cell cycle sensor histidine kinase and response regulator CckA
LGQARPETSKMSSLLTLDPQEVLKSVLDNVGVAVAVIDHQGRIVYTNQAACKMFGATAAADLPFGEWRRDYKFQDSQGREIPTEQAPLARALAGEEVKPHYVRVTLPDGRVKWLHGASHPFTVLGLTGVLIVATDETEQAELRKALEQAQRIEAVGILAGGLAHDLNNLLSILSGNIALALGDEGVNRVTCGRLQEMQMALRKGSALVSRLMKYSRKQDTQIRPIQINEVVNAALELVRPLLKSEVGVRTQLSDRLPDVQADSSQLEQVFVNLILNALDAMPEGGELSFCTELVSGDAIPGGNDEKKKQFVLVTIADTGIGIPKNFLRNIFEPFSTTKPIGAGTGLGLSSAQLIVHQHNGHINVQSVSGAGTKFSIYLPVHP